MLSDRLAGIENCIHPTNHPLSTTKHWDWSYIVGLSRGSGVDFEGRAINRRENRSRLIFLSRLAIKTNAIAVKNEFREFSGLATLRLIEFSARA